MRCEGLSKKQKADNMKNHIVRFSVKILSLNWWGTINLFTYSPMFLFTYTNRLLGTVAAVAVDPARARSVEVPAVYVVVAVLLTRPKVEVRSKSEGFGG